MAPLLGVLGGAGLLLIWWSSWEQPPTPERRPRASRLEDLLRAAGIEKVSKLGLIATCCGVGAFVTLVFFAGTRSWPISGCFGLFGGWLAAGHRAVAGPEADRPCSASCGPTSWTTCARRSVPGLSLPEALIQLGDKGPAELRPAVP